jgi:hypothetical protein
MASSAEAGRDQPWDQSPLDGMGTRLQIKGDDSLVSPPCSPFMPLRSLPPIPFQKRSSLLKKVPRLRFRDLRASAAAPFRAEILRKSGHRDSLRPRCGPRRAFFNRLAHYRNHAPGFSAREHEDAVPNTSTISELPDPLRPEAGVHLHVPKRRTSSVAASSEAPQRDRSHHHSPYPSPLASAGAQRVITLSP